MHHSQLISELLLNGRIQLQGDNNGNTVTFHDPCYLGRQNQIIEDPRLALMQTGKHLIEMPYSRNKSFCCGAGGAQIWKEEETGSAPMNQTRFSQAQELNVDKLAVGCPFCMVMLNDASKDLGSQMEVLDIAEMVASQISD